jgi:hypothetical protein
MIQAGQIKVGAKSVFERIRWESKIKRMDQYKVNNNFTADYARKFEQDYPHFSGIFEKRLCKKR